MATKQRILQNNQLVWVDANINEKERDTKHTLEQLRSIIHHIELFTEINHCLRFLEKIKYEQALIITSGSLGQDLVKKIHHLAQVDAIYIFCSHPDRHQNWAKDWSKIKGVYNQIMPICEALRTAVKQTDEDLTPISFVTQTVGDDQEKSAGDLNRLEPSFMYTTLFKRILLNMKHEPNARQAIVKFYRTHHAGNRQELTIIDEFDREYRADKAIWWYTRECFTYQMLNRALRLLESDIIVDMGFFMHDLHRALEELHRQQFSNYSGSPLTLYRGQPLSMKDFTKLEKSRGGLLAFNSFLSTSTSEKVSFDFAQRSSKRDNMVGIFFVMTVDPTIRSAIFADVAGHSYYPRENEILFSMHTVFRIEEVVELDERQRLFGVWLTLTSEDDPELSGLTNKIEEEVGGGIGWEQLGRVLLRVGQVNKAEEIYLFLLRQESSGRDQALYHHQLGLIKDRQGDYNEAVKYYEQAISIGKRVHSSADPSLASSYTGIGSVYRKMGDYSQALSYHNKALTIWNNTLPANHPDLATSCNNIGAVYEKMGEHFPALSYYSEALAIRVKTLPANHPDLAQSNNNIGAVYEKMGDYSQALSYHNKAFTIWNNTLPANHPDLAISCNNIGAVYEKMRDYSPALSYYSKALAIRVQILPVNHSDLARSYNNIGVVNYKLGEYMRAKTHFEKAFEIWKCSLPPEHPRMHTSKKWLDLVNKQLQSQNSSSSSCLLE